MSTLPDKANNSDESEKVHFVALSDLFGLEVLQEFSKEFKVLGVIFLVGFSLMQYNDYMDRKDFEMAMQEDKETEEGGSEVDKKNN